MGDAPVGAGIQTITGNAGGAVGPTMAGDVAIVGAGTIVVTGNPGGNSLTISSGATPATYTADAGFATPDAFGNINVIGGLNINTVGAADTLTVNLNDNVTLTGDLLADNITANHDITALIGDISTATGNIISSGIVYGMTGGTFDNTVDITAGGLQVTGPVQLFSVVNPGVVQIDATNTLFADNGTDGQVLIGGGVAPAWALIVGAGGIVVGTGANTITLTCDGTVPQVFTTDSGNAIPVAGVLDVNGGTNINTAGAGNSVTVNLDDDVTLAGFLHAGTDISAGTSLFVGTYADIGDYLNVGGALAVTGTSVFNNNMTVNGHITLPGLHNINGYTSSFSFSNAAVFTGDGIEIATQAKLQYAPNGVLVTNGTGVVSATNAAQGNIIMGAGAGVTPIWGTLTSTGGTVAITTPTANTINLEVAAATPIAFRAVLSPGVPYAGDASTPPYEFGTSRAMTTIYNYGGGFYPGDGAAAYATFTAPVSGVYTLVMKACLGWDSAATAHSWAGIMCWLRFMNITTGTNYSEYIDTSNSSVPRIANVQYVDNVPLAAGDIVKFVFEPHRTTGFASQHYQIGPDYAGNGACSISGTKVA